LLEREKISIAKKHKNQLKISLREVDKKIQTVASLKEECI
jgi:hypothetical protein